MTTLYHPTLSPQLNWNFASYTEYAEAQPVELTIGGVKKYFPCIQLKDGDSIQQARMNGWEFVPEQTTEQVTTKPKKGRPRKKK